MRINHKLSALLAGAVGAVVSAGEALAVGGPVEAVTTALDLGTMKTEVTAMGQSWIAVVVVLMALGLGAAMIKKLSRG